MGGDQHTVNRRRDLTLGVVIVFVMLWVLFTQARVKTWNDKSRLASVEALVHQGTWAIENTTLGNLTEDRIFWNGRFYSDKPPTLSFVASGVYAILHHGLRLSLNPQECVSADGSYCCFALLCSQQSPDWAYYIITVMLIGLPSALMLALFYKSMAFHGLSNLSALIFTGALGLGTLIVPYSLVFNNHIPTAACLMLSLYTLIRARENSPHQRVWLFIAGLSVSLALTLEFNLGTFLVLWGGYVLWRYRSQAMWFFLGSLLPLMLMLALDRWILGDWLPPQMHPAGYNYPGSPLYATVGGTHGAANVFDYSFRMLLGDYGLFAFMPVMFWIVYAVVATLSDKDYRWRLEAFIVSLASLATVLYLLLFTDSFGGYAYSPRWFIAMTPVLFFFATRPVFYRSTARQWLFAVLVALSIASAWRGISDPWRPDLPLVRLETTDASVTYTALTQQQVAAIPHPLNVTFGNRVQLLGYAVDVESVYPGGQIKVTLYWKALSRMSEDYAVFIHLTSLTDVVTAQSDTFVGSSGIPTSQWRPGDVIAETYIVDVGVTAYAPDRAVLWVGLYLPGQPRLPAHSTVGQLAEDAVRLSTIQLLPHPGAFPNSTRVNFGDQFSLVGYALSGRVIYPGETLSVTLYWQALTTSPRDSSVSLRLVDSNESVRATNESYPNTQPRRTSHWLPGQVLQETRSLTVPVDATPGLYDVTLGILDSETGWLPASTPDGRGLGAQTSLVRVRVGGK